MNARVCVRVQTHGHAHVHTITRTHRAHTRALCDWALACGARVGAAAESGFLAGPLPARGHCLWKRFHNEVDVSVGDGDLCAQRWCPLGLRAPPRGLRLAPRGVLTWAFLLPVLRGGLALTQ